jgi:hypothetical protein
VHDVRARSSWHPCFPHLTKDLLTTALPVLVCLTLVGAHSMTLCNRACEPRDGRSMVRQKQHGKRRPVLGMLDPNRGLLQLRKEAKRSHDRAVPGLVPWKRAWEPNVSLGAWIDFLRRNIHACAEVSFNTLTMSWSSLMVTWVSLLYWLQRFDIKLTPTPTAVDSALPCVASAGYRARPLKRTIHRP